MKGLIRKKIIFGALIALISVSLIGCSTTSKSKSKSKENEVQKNLVEQSFEQQIIENKEVAEKEVAEKEVAEKEVAEKEVAEKEVAEKEVAEKEVAEKVGAEKIINTEMLSKKLNSSEVEEVIELPIDYPFGIEPIVKSDKIYDTFDLIVVHTSDTYGKIDFDDDYIGFSKLSTMVKSGRILTQNLLVLDAGNSLFSLPLINKSDLSTSQKLQNLIEYDAIAPQSMAFKLGVKDVFNLSIDSNQTSKELLLSSNLLDNNNYFPLQPYKLYDFNGFIVCVVGLTSPFESNSIKQEGYTFDSNLVFENAQYAIDVMKQYVDYIVVLGSMGSGLVNDIYNSSFICSHLNGIDLFIDGQYSTVESGSVVNGSIIVNTKAKLEEVGVVDILITNNEVKSVTPITIEASDVNEPMKSALASSFGISIIDDDQVALQIIKEGKASYNSISDKVIAKASYPLSLENKNIKQTSLSNLLSNYIVNSTKADVCMLSSALFYDSIEKGDITLDEIGNAMPTFNRLCYTTMSGQEIFTALELSYGTLPEGSEDFIQTNIKVLYNRYAEIGNRIIRAKIGKNYIDKDSIYTVISDDSLASENSRYNMGEISQFIYFPAYYLQMAILDKFGSLEYQFK